MEYCVSPHRVSRFNIFYSVHKYKIAAGIAKRTDSEGRIDIFNIAVISVSIKIQYESITRLYA
jgi:hypothetical protein